MTVFAMTTLALGLPLLLGALWLYLLIPAHTVARPLLAWGNGALLGLLLIPQLLRALDALGMPLAFQPAAAIVSILAAVAALLLMRSRRGSAVTAPVEPPMPAVHRILFTLLAVLLLTRTVTLGLEILWRPLFPWDATMHWATKAKVWFELGWMAPFVENDVWLNSGGAGVFTDRHAGYPPTIPLLQVWMNLATGRWDESLMNLPWLLCFLALGCAFYGQLRVAGTKALPALVFTYLLLSMPLLNIHVALAGYADLFLGAAYCAALMAFHNWLCTRQRWQGLLAIVFALACVVIKNEGLPWALTLLPALALSVSTRHRIAKLLLLLALALTLLAVLAYKNPAMVSGALAQTTRLHMAGLAGMIRVIWLHDNWHLLGYLFAIVIPLGLLLPGALTRRYLGLAIALACALLLFLILFLFTEFGAGASNFTGVGRLSLHLFPGALFFCALLCNELLARDTPPAAATN